MYRSEMIKCLIIMLTVRMVVVCTVDVDLPEMKYLADHLTPEECRRLAAALHFKSYNAPNGLDSAEAKVSEDIPCLRLLLHWNSAESEGRGETHEMLFRRLRQIGRDDLAEWLGKTVFHELSQDLKKSLDEPFQEFLAENNESSQVSTTTTMNPVSLREDQFAWLPFDTICVSLITILILTTIALVTRSIILNCKSSNPKKKPMKLRNRMYGKYEKMENLAGISESESEDKFDIRKKDDPALKLMGV